MGGCPGERVQPFGGSPESSASRAALDHPRVLPAGLRVVLLILVAYAVAVILPDTLRPASLYQKAYPLVGLAGAVTGDRHKAGHREAPGWYPLGTLGFELAVDEAAARLVVDGRGGTVPALGAELNAGGAGTAMRFLLGFLTLGRGHFRLDGNQRMRERPIGPLLDTLAALGISVRAERDNGCPPVAIEIAVAFPAKRFTNSGFSRSSFDTSSQAMRW